MSGPRAGEAPVLELRALDVPFGDEVGLSALSLTIEDGERFVLVGASGAGKSSLLRAIAGTGRLTSGTIRIDGSAAAASSPHDRRLVLLEQRPLLFPHLSVRQNVAFPLDVRGVGRDEAERRVTEALEAVRLPDVGDRMPGTLSGGQAHRIALARAVVARPRILLLDEPLASLDPSLRDELRRTIVEVAGRYRTALLMVTHDLGEAGRIGQRVGVLVDGRLAQVDTPDVLFRRPASLEVARFIGWTNELPARVEEDGTVRVGAWTVEGPAAAKPTGAYALPAPGAATLSFGVQGARLSASERHTGVGVPVRVTALRHDPRGLTAEYTLDPPIEGSNGAASGGEVAVDPTAALEVGAPASLSIVLARARLFPAPLTGRRA